jgi:Kef-type K+ transport system membrane component KefB
MLESLARLVGALVVATTFGKLARTLGQPSVLGELAAGVLLGSRVLPLWNTGDVLLQKVAEFGVVVLLFQIGLHTDLRALSKVGGAAFTVACVGVVLPFAGGVLLSRQLGIGMVAALVCGAALTATSIGISSRILSDLGQLDTPEGQVVLGAAVLDDLMGLIILAVISTIAGGGSVSAWRGSALILGAFAAGLLLHPTPQRQSIAASVRTLAHVVVPMFFVGVGASVDLHALLAPEALLAGAVLTAVGVVGKVAAGFAPWWFTGNKWLVGVAMVPRGEVGLIFAQVGMASGALTPAFFGSLMLMIFATTFVTPIVLARVARRSSHQRPRVIS